MENTELAYWVNELDPEDARYGTGKLPWFSRGVLGGAYWTVTEIIAEINRDRGVGWTDYDESDWQEGWLEFIEPAGYHSMILFSEGSKLTFSWDPRGPEVTKEGSVFLADGVEFDPTPSWEGA
tara:strand:+ start:3811 stop:4179 length:369 start_codon:yes stop_codon:yes gene_type:complete